MTEEIQITRAEAMDITRRVIEQIERDRERAVLRGSGNAKADALAEEELRAFQRVAAYLGTHGATWAADNGNR